MKITCNKKATMSEKRLAFVCKAASPSIIGRSMDSVLFLDDADTTIVTAYATDGKRLHFAQLLREWVESLKVYICDRDNPDSWIGTEFVHRAKSSWILGGKTEGKYPNVLKVIPEIFSNIDNVNIKTKRYQTDKHSFVANYFYKISRLESGNFPVINPEFLYDIYSDNFCSWIGQIIGPHKPVRLWVEAFEPHVMGAVIMPMDMTEGE